MTSEQKLSGGCHCRAVTFEAVGDLSFVTECNCSICEMKGLNLAFAPADSFVLKSGENHLSEYRFNREKIGHVFCRVCGVETFGRASKPDGTPMVALNVRCLDGVDWKALPKTPYDGRSA